MIVIPLKEGQKPGKSSDQKYVILTRNYDNQVEGEPYITAEFANDKSRTTFPVGDGKYYSRDGVTDAKRKRRAACELTLNVVRHSNENIFLFRNFSDKSVLLHPCGKIR